MHQLAPAQNIIPIQPPSKDPIMTQIKPPPKNESRQRDNKRQELQRGLNETETPRVRDDIAHLSEVDCWTSSTRLLVGTGPFPIRSQS